MKSLSSLGIKAKNFYVRNSLFNTDLFANELSQEELKLFKDFLAIKDRWRDTNLNKENIHIYIQQVKEVVKSENILHAIDLASKKLKQGEKPQKVLKEFTKEAEPEANTVSPVNFWDAYSFDELWDDLQTTIEEFKQNSTFSKGKVITLMGDTGALKTAASIHLCFDLLRKNPSAKVCFFQKEMPLADMLIRIKSYFTNIENNLIKTKEKEVDTFFCEVKEAKTDQHSLIKSVLERFYIVEPNKFHNVLDMEDYVLTTKANVFVLDYLALMSAANNDSGNFNDGVQKLCYELKDFTTRHNLLGIIITQLRKGTVESRTNKIPQLDDMEWSGALKQVSASVIAVFYPHLYYTGEIPDTLFYLVVKKGRYGQPLDPVCFNVNPKTQKLSYLRPGGQDYHDAIRGYDTLVRSKSRAIR